MKKKKLSGIYRQSSSFSSKNDRVKDTKKDRGNLNMYPFIKTSILHTNSKLELHLCLTYNVKKIAEKKISDMEIGN